MPLSTLSLAMAGALLLAPSVTDIARPDFSGRWVFDQAASIQASAVDRRIAAPMFGDEFIARQSPATLTLEIRSGPLTVTAIYKLNGSDSRNQSPAAEAGQAAVTVSSRASWDGDKLVIVSTSHSEVDGSPVPVESTRVMWFDGDGRLNLDRRGTPASLVPSTRSVYRKIP